MTRFIATTLGLLALVACSKKEEPPAPAPAAETPIAASVTPPAPSEAAPAPSASAAAADVPVEEDYEDEANLKVNAQTLDAQLDALEKEIKAN